MSCYFLHTNNSLSRGDMRQSLTFHNITNGINARDICFIVIINKYFPFIRSYTNIFKVDERCLFLDLPKAILRNCSHAVRKNAGLGMTMFAKGNRKRRA